MKNGQLMTGILKIISDCTTNDNDMDNAAPNLIEDLVYEYLLENNESEQTADQVSTAVFNLTSDLVKEIGYYK